MPHPAMSPNHVAVITGGASGIGLAAATRFASLGMKVCIADIGEDRLKEAAAGLASVAKGGAADVMTAAVDVSRFDDLAAMRVADLEALSEKIDVPVDRMKKGKWVENAKRLARQVAATST